ncbi:SDR family oxidoreductase [Cupriavidus basilensis]
MVTGTPPSGSDGVGVGFAARYPAYETGPMGIQVHSVLPGLLKIRAASGLTDFDLTLNAAMQRALLGDLVDSWIWALPARFWQPLCAAAFGHAVSRWRREHHGLTCHDN